MRKLFRCSVVLIFVSGCWAQTTAPEITAESYTLPSPLPVAPGELLTLFASGPSGSNVSAVFWNGADQSIPVLRVDSVPLFCTGLPFAACAQTLAVTIQIPFGIPTLCTLCASPAQPIAGSVALIVNGVKTPYVSVQPLQDHVHFLTYCDVIVAGANSTSPPAGGLPCTPVVTHADGRAVSAILPATAGEELVAYATGLGETNPALSTGQPASASNPTITTFGIDFNYRANSLATKPATAGVPTASPLFTGATKGYIGLYQINFVVPPPPAGLVPCVDNATLPPYGNAVQSNLTVSVGSNFSFDGAGICVTPTGVQPSSP